MHALDAETPKYLVIVKYNDFDPTGMYPFISLEKAEEEYAKHAGTCEGRFLTKILKQE